jgi:hypothetical protein
VPSNNINNTSNTSKNIRHISLANHAIRRDNHTLAVPTTTSNCWQSIQQPCQNQQ